MPTALVTGSTDGIGLETARQLLQRGWRVLLHGRDSARAMSALKALGATGARAATVHGDLASMAQVQGLAAEVRQSADALDVLLLNAGVYESKRSVTADGFERTMAVNHFAHLLLALALKPLLSAAPSPRVVWVSSGVHRGARLDPADLDLGRGWDPYGSYASSKLANAVCAAEMARRPEHKGILSLSLHPGVVTTKLLTRNFGSAGVPVEEGARTSLHCALSPGLESRNGAYFNHCAPAEPDPRVKDPAFGRALWDQSLVRLKAWL
jgi:NAD(P)-dependent dehydrogenase (short-subunit alcohol dehydrogenase family)